MHALEAYAATTLISLIVNHVDRLQEMIHACDMVKNIPFVAFSSRGMQFYNPVQRKALHLTYANKLSRSFI